MSRASPFGALCAAACLLGRGLASLVPALERLRRGAAGDTSRLRGVAAHSPSRAPGASVAPPPALWCMHSPRLIGRRRAVATQARLVLTLPSRRSYVVLVAMGGALFGLEISNISTAHELLCNHDFASVCGPKAKSTAFFQGLVTSCITIGAFFGTATSGIPQERLGRKFTLVVASVIYIVGVVIEIVSPSYAILVTGRILVGIGVGWFAATVPMYIAELSPSSIRGRLVTANQVSRRLCATGRGTAPERPGERAAATVPPLALRGMRAPSQLNICIGILLGYVVNWGFAGGASPPSATAWRWILGVGVAPAAVLFFAFLLVTPRSPRWLAKQHR